MPTSVTIPKGLGEHARRTWRSITKRYELRADELRMLEDACRTIDIIDRMQARLDDPNTALVVKGSTGQSVANPLVQEIRQQRAVLKGLFAALKLSEVDEAPAAAGERSASARDAATARWGRGA